MRALGHLWLWVGFLGAAFCSVYQLEVADQKWITIPWGWYTFSMCIGVAGVVVLRHSKHQDHADDAQTEAEYSVVRESLQMVAAHVEELANRPKQVPSQVLRTIDDRCAQPLADFADSRQAMVKRFGLKVYADVMTEFAAAERYINRSWSAAADGYVEEVQTSLNRAHAHLHKAMNLLASAEGSQDETTNHDETK